MTKQWNGPFFECPGCGKDIADMDTKHAPDCPSLEAKNPLDSPDDEPEAICGNCDSWKEDLNGNRHCLNGHSSLETLLTDYNDTCQKFFPDPQRWPDADHAG